MKPWTKESEARDRESSKPTKQKESEHAYGWDNLDHNPMEDVRAVQEMMENSARTVVAPENENTREIQERLKHSTEEASKSAGELIDFLGEVDPREPVQKRGRPSKKSRREGTYPRRQEEK